MAIADFVKTNVPQWSTEGLTDSILATYVDTAIDIYSRLFPREVVSQTTATSGNTSYTFSLPTSWEDEFSHATKVEYPIGDNPPTYLEDDDYTIYLSPSTSVNTLLFIETLPVEDFALYYTMRWSESTLSDFQSSSVGYLASALVCDRLATKYASHASEQFSADIMVWRTKTREYESVRDNYYHVFYLCTGANPKDLAPAAAMSFGESNQTAGLYIKVNEI